MKAYGSRVLEDLRSFAKAFLLTLIAILPLVVILYGVYGLFVYLFLLLLGIANVVVFGFLTAVLQSYVYKLAVFAVAIAANAWLMRSSFSAVSGLFNLTLVVFSQVVFLFGMFYVWLEHRKIASWLRSVGRFE